MDHVLISNVPSPGMRFLTRFFFADPAWLKRMLHDLKQIKSSGLSAASSSMRNRSTKSAVEREGNI